MTLKNEEHDIMLELEFSELLETSPENSAETNNDRR